MLDAWLKGDGILLNTTCTMVATAFSDTPCHSLDVISMLGMNKEYSPAALSSIASEFVSMLCMLHTQKMPSHDSHCNGRNVFGFTCCSFRKCGAAFRIQDPASSH